MQGLSTISLYFHHKQGRSFCNRFGLSPKRSILITKCSVYLFQFIDVPATYKYIFCEFDFKSCYHLILFLNTFWIMQLQCWDNSRWPSLIIQGCDNLTIYNIISGGNCLAFGQGVFGHYSEHQASIPADLKDLLKSANNIWILGKI